MNKIDINHKNAKNETIFHNAGQSGNINLIKYLLSIGKFDINKVDGNKQTPLFHAIKAMSFLAVRYLANLENINLEARYLHTAIEFNDNVFNYLFALKKIPLNERDNDNRTLLHYTVDRNNLSIVKQLITLSELDALDKDINGMNIFHIACKSGYIDIIKKSISMRFITYLFDLIF